MKGIHYCIVQIVFNGEFGKLVAVLHSYERAKHISDMLNDVDLSSLYCVCEVDNNDLCTRFK